MLMMRASGRGASVDDMDGRRILEHAPEQSQEGSFAVLFRAQLI
jgi:hypothetical protein